MLHYFTFSFNNLLIFKIAIKTTGVQQSSTFKQDSLLVISNISIRKLTSLLFMQSSSAT